MIYDSRGGFPNEIKTKIRYKFVVFMFLGYENMIKTNNKISYFGFISFGNPPLEL